MAHDVDLLFRVDAGSEYGFGHAARCIQLSKLIAERKPNLTMAFQGEYSRTARERIVDALPHMPLHPVELNCTGNLVVFDTMFDALDVNGFGLEEARELQAKGSKVLALFSGTRPPEMEGLRVLGYQPCEVVASPPMLRWGLEYAPVSPDLLSHGPLPERQPGKVLVALGGHPDDHFLRATLRAMKPVTWIEEIDLLLSPVMGRRSSRYTCGRDKRINIFKEVPSVAPLLASCELAIVSYGNLAFEGMALGTPLCLVGQKGFQRELARKMEELRLVVASDPTDKELPGVLQELRHDASEISLRAKSAIDFKGLVRVADVLLQELPSAFNLLTG